MNGNGDGAQATRLCERCETARRVQDLTMRHFATERESTNLVAEFREMRESVTGHLTMLSDEVCRLTSIVKELSDQWKKHALP
jgi:hypothetical protein